MASGPINSWQIDGERVETVTGFLGSKITPDDDHSHEINFFSLEEKLWPTWQRIKKQKHYFANKDLSSQIYGFPSSLVWMWELDYKESWGPKNWCFWTVVLEKTLESPFNCKSILKEISLNIHWKDWSWSSNTLATSCEELTHWKRLWCWEVLGAGGEGDDRGWDGWTASLTRWTWVWVNSRSWWWTGRPGVLRFMGSQRVGHDWVTELNFLFRNLFQCSLLSEDSNVAIKFEKGKSEIKTSLGFL